MSQAPRKSAFLGVLFVLVALAALCVAAYWWWQGRERAPAGEPPAAVSQGPADAPAAVPPTPAASPAIQHPLAPASAPIPAEGISEALTEWLGRKAVLGFLLLDDFPRRVVATVDNLGRAQASARLWPVQPTPGRFDVRDTVLSADNELRYAPFVQLAESVDPAQAALVYRRLYPLLQQAYAELGYPRASFNDRLIQMIDLLLATPEPAGPLAVRLMAANSPLPPPRPWVLYEFADPALERLPAGQKLLLRMGPVNERRLKVRLRALRAQIVAAEPR